jgi:hypothetical protein
MACGKSSRERKSGGIYGNVLPRWHSGLILDRPERKCQIMVKTAGTGEGASGTARRGLLRLMLRLPALRGRLQVLATRPSPLDDLFEAYEDAAATLDRLQQRCDRRDAALIEEYLDLCGAIEADIQTYVLGRFPHKPE